jgi:hypothetical protein
MFKQWLPLCTSGLVLTTTMVTSLTFPVVSHAESPLPQMFPVLQGITLTPQQTADIQTLRNQMLPQLMQVLTPAQKEQLQAELDAGKGLRVAVLSLNLNMSQRLQIMRLLQGMQTQITQILTPAQQQQARQNLQTLQRQGR